MRGPAFAAWPAAGTPRGDAGAQQMTELWQLFWSFGRVGASAFTG
eukprot:SAG22_NODE_14460_length_374_cov_0.840000_1_plen_44_part_01